MAAPLFRVQHVNLRTGEILRGSLYKSAAQAGDVAWEANRMYAAAGRWHMLARAVAEVV